ncbi:hypothetical protein OIY81_1826 [Cryptosporidium canis]|uniref:Secreted protein n=1 Tax=Cryptosporidium canis TaxID=195482 RepID=A0ABQ8P4R9_9CRYT|nr:hypothetical protein OJ252_2595 [Cryptosporidium canis]KAJ1611073.1 hypothetical protein OIY81_1826 [Cryptosporidium canis]
METGHLLLLLWDVQPALLLERLRPAILLCVPGGCGLPQQTCRLPVDVNYLLMDASSALILLWGWISLQWCCHQCNDLHLGTKKPIRQNVGLHLHRQSSISALGIDGDGAGHRMETLG